MHALDEVDEAGVIGLAGRGGLLLVIDDAHRWPIAHLDTLIHNLRSLTAESGVPVRILLSARTNHRWLEVLSTRMNELAIPAQRVELAPLGFRQDRAEAFDMAVTGFMRTMNFRTHPANHYRVGLDLTNPRYTSVLALHMTALTAIHSRITMIAPTYDEATVSNYLREREYADWDNRYRENLLSTDPDTMHRVVYLATLTGGMPHHDARTVLARLALAADEATADRLIDDHRRCYPETNSATVLPPLQPDQFGEDFLALTIPGHPDTTTVADPWARTTTCDLFRIAGDNPTPWAIAALTKLLETADRWPHVATTVIYPILQQNPTLPVSAGAATLTRLAAFPDNPPEILLAIEQHLADHPDIDAATAATTIDTAPLPHRITSSTDPAEQAALYLTYGDRLADGSRFHDAHTAIQNATDLYRQLAKTNPETHLPDLARSLNNLGIRLGGVGRHREAVDSAQEAVTLFRRLVETNPDTYLPDLARSLANLGIRLGGVGRHREALDSAQEAVTLFRRLVETNPDTYLPDLAGSLANLGIRLGGVGRHREALDSAQEAVTLFRRLVETNPDTYLPDLAGSLANLGIRLGGVGRHREALDSAQEAVTLRRWLVETNPDTYLPDLAGSLANLGIRLGEVGRHREAVDSAQEAVTLYRRLVETNPDTYLPDLARSLDHLGIRLGEVGRHREAVDSAQEAVTLFRRLVETNPDTYLPDLARSLTNLGSRLGEVGRHREALDSAQEAVTLYRRLVETNPDTYLPDLARSLANLGIRLGEVGRHREALDSAQEAITLYRRLVETNPDTYLPDLARSLANLGTRLSMVGRHREALDSAQEAVVLYRPLADANPDTYKPAFGVVLLIFAESCVRAKLNLDRGLSRRPRSNRHI